MGKYDDIINLPHPDPYKRTRMSLYNRAAQFSPFSALTGHDDAIKETGRLTDGKIELEQDAVEDINRKLTWIKDNINSKPKVTITYFVPDESKSGGRYVTKAVTVVKVDEVNRWVVSEDNCTILLNCIWKIN